MNGYIIRLRTEDETQVTLDNKAPFATKEVAVEAAKEIIESQRFGQATLAEELANESGYEFDADSVEFDGTVYVETAEQDEDGEYFGSVVWYQNI